MKYILSAILLITNQAWAAPLITTTMNDEGEHLLSDTFSRTLYVFDVDQNTPDTSACNGNCAEVWPPYILSAEEAASLQPPLGQVKRANQKIQLTYEGRPVYLYAFDRKPGDDLGDGVGNVWHYIEVKQ